jgi:hypothetical protein
MVWEREAPRKSGRLRLEGEHLREKVVLRSIPTCANTITWRTSLVVLVTRKDFPHRSARLSVGKCDANVDGASEFIFELISVQIKFFGLGKLFNF